MNTPVFFPGMPDKARLWIFAADRTLSKSAKSSLHDALNPFFRQWQAHGYPVTGEASILHDRFLLIAAYIPDPRGDISGCSIDALTRQLEEAGRALEVEWASPLNVFYRDRNGEVQQASRPAFQQRLSEGAVHEDTPVFDPSLTTVAALRRGEFEQPLQRSFLSQLHSA